MITFVGILLRTTHVQDLSRPGITRLGDFLSQINIRRQPLSPLQEIPSLQLLCSQSIMISHLKEPSMMIHQFMKEIG